MDWSHVLVGIVSVVGLWAYNKFWLNTPVQPQVPQPQPVQPNVTPSPVPVPAPVGPDLMQQLGPILLQAMQLFMLKLQKEHQDKLNPPASPVLPTETPKA